MSKIPIIFYHSVSGHNSRLAIEVKVFEKQIKYLFKKGYTTITPFDLFSKNILNKKKKILICFDDGFRDNYTNAFPILKKYGFVATVFVATAYIGKISSYAGDQNDKNLKMLNENKIVKLEDAGWTIANHLHSHRNLIDLSENEIKQEFEKSKEILGGIIKNKKALNVISYPRNKFNQKIKNILKENGVKMAFAGSRRMFGENEDFMELPRIEIDKDVSFLKFKMYLNEYFYFLKKVLKK